MPARPGGAAGTMDMSTAGSSRPPQLLSSAAFISWREMLPSPSLSSIQSSPRRGAAAGGGTSRTRPSKAESLSTSPLSPSCSQTSARLGAQCTAGCGRSRRVRRDGTPPDRYVGCCAGGRRGCVSLRSCVGNGWSDGGGRGCWANNISGGLSGFGPWTAVAPGSACLPKPRTTSKLARQLPSAARSSRPSRTA